MTVALHGDPVWLPELLRRVRVQIVSSTGYPADAVFYTQHDDAALIQFAPASRFLALRVPSLTPDMLAFAGGGRLTAVFDGTIQAALFVRLNTDQEFRADRMMLESDGVYAELLKVVKALSIFSPLDATGGTVGLTRQPIRPVGSVTFNTRRASESVSWSVATSSWSAPFVADIPASP